MRLICTQKDRVRLPPCPPFLIGPVAQLGEHLPCKQGVVGSIPTRSTKVCCRVAKRFKADACKASIRGFESRPGVGVIGEPGRPRHPVTVKIAGSNPAGSAKSFEVLVM